MWFPYICTFTISYSLLIHPAYGGSMLIQNQIAWHHTPEGSNCQDESWWSLIHTLPPSTTMILSQWTTYFIWWAIVSTVAVGNKLNATWFSIPSSSSSTVASGSSSTSTWQHKPTKHTAWWWHFYSKNYVKYCHFWWWYDIQGGLHFLHRLLSAYYIFLHFHFYRPIYNIIFRFSNLPTIGMCHNSISSVLPCTTCKSN